MFTYFSTSTPLTASAHPGVKGLALAVDLNNTIMDQIGGIVRASKGRLARSDFDRWDVDLSGKLGMSRGDYLEWAWSNPYTELTSDPLPGAGQALSRLKRAGASILIVTASVLSHREIRGWLRLHAIPFDAVIRTDDKRGIGDVLIDDSPVTCQKFYEAGWPIIRYSLPWNEHLAHIPAIREWRQAGAILGNGAYFMRGRVIPRAAFSSDGNSWGG